MCNALITTGMCVRMWLSPEEEVAALIEAIAAGKEAVGVSPLEPMCASGRRSEHDLPGLGLGGASESSSESPTDSDSDDSSDGACW